MTAPTLDRALEPTRVLRRVTPTGLLVAPSGLQEMDEDAWLEMRRTGIGGSDVGTLLGLNRYQSPFDLYLDKRGERPDRARSEALDRAAKWGHIHEPNIAAEFSKRYGLRTRRIGLLRHTDREWQLANLDRQVHGCPDGPCLLEIKTRSAYKASEWGPSESEDGVPDNEALQTTHYLDVTGYRHAHVGVLINGNDDRYYRIDWDEGLAGDVRRLEETFWQRILNSDAPPLDGHTALAEFMSELYAGREGATTTVDLATARKLIDGRAVLKEHADLIAEQIAAAENQLKGLLGDNEIALGPDGKPVFTWKRNGVLATKKLRDANPELVAAYMRPTVAFDAKAFAADHPDTYRANRARVLRITSGG